MKRWKGKAAVVTGAATGFGRAIALKLVEEGMKVYALPPPHTHPNNPTNFHRWLDSTLKKTNSTK